MIFFAGLAKEHAVATPGFNRWLVPPAALAVHLCIGMAYGFSVFWKPLGRALEGSDGVALDLCAAGATTIEGKMASLWRALFATDCNWSQFDLGWIYTLFFVLLGCSAALWGGWLERVGPRRAGVVAASCWCGGLLLAALGVAEHQLWLVWLGAGGVGGVGLGLGYISPVSTLVKWFPDRRGMATGLAIMGFGGGAMIGSPLATLLMEKFASPGQPGVWQTFVVLALIYAVFMFGGALGYRIPASDWPGARLHVPAEPRGGSFIAVRHVHVRNAHRTPQFWLLWIMLCLNVSAGIGIIGAAAPMMQETFGGALIGQPSLDYAGIKANPTALAGAVAVAAGFVGLLSLFNIGGRIFWASVSDHWGRRRAFCVFFALGAGLYLLSGFAAREQLLGPFVLSLCLLASLYGGVFATIPAYLADLFGTQFVGAIHGRLLTAWSVAGLVGPAMVNYLHDTRLESHLAFQQIYAPIFYALAGLLVMALLANLAVRPVADRLFMSEKELAQMQKLAPQRRPHFGFEAAPEAKPPNTSPVAVLVLAWLAVGVPLAFGIWVTLQKTSAMFQ
jgi:MFS family permease